MDQCPESSLWPKQTTGDQEQGRHWHGEEINFQVVKPIISDGNSVIMLQAVDLLFVETTDQDSCPQVTPATHCCWSFVRSGGKNLKSSQAYTQSFADWVLKNHQVQGIPGDAWTCRGIYLGKAILSSTSLKVALNTSMCSMFTNFGAMSSLDAGKQTAHITRISKVLIV